MAIIGKIRSYSWLLLAFIGLALLAFILGDFIKKGSSKGADTTLAEVAGETVNYIDFDAEYQEQVELYKQQYKKSSLDKQTSDQIREEIWNQKLREIIIHKQAKRLGLIVSGKESKDYIISPEELKELTMGKEPHPFVTQFFTQGNPQSFNPQQVVQFITNFDQQDEFVKKLWLFYEKNIKEDRLNNKYFALISKGLYVTKAEAKRSFDSRNKLVKFRFTSLRYNTISDSAVKVTDQEIQKYYDKQKFKYEQEAGRDLEYVLFDVVPSKEDFNLAKEEITKLAAEFQKDEDAAAFVNYNADTKYSNLYQRKGVLDPEVDSVMFKAPIGTMVGPYLINNTYKLAKLIDRKVRPDSLEARHILIAYKGSLRADAKVTLTKEQAKAKADSIMMAVKKDTSKFGAMAIQLSNDPSAKENKGNLGWFTDGSMVKEFNEACINNKKGDIFVVATDFGYHVINLINKTVPAEKIQVAIVDRLVEPSETTFNKVYSDANTFASEVTTPELFESKIVEKGLNKRIAESVKETDRALPGMENPIELVRWAYKSEKGAISQAFDVTDKYVVAILKSVKLKGYATLEQIKSEMELGAKQVKKGEMLADKIKAANAKSIEELATKLNTKVDTADGLSFSSFGIPLLGAEPAVIGSVFGLKQGQLSKPIIGKTGVVVVIVDEFKDVATTADLVQTKAQMVGYLGQRAKSEGYNALMKLADVKDLRGKFY
ncbi:MAG: peptidylprolyl isomerase [Bacteroidota bacterium]